MIEIGYIGDMNGLESSHIIITTLIIIIMDLTIIRQEANRYVRLQCNPIQSNSEKNMLQREREREREFWLSEGRNEKKHTKEEEVEVVLAKSKGRRYLFIIPLGVVNNGGFGAMLHCLNIL